MLKTVELTYTLTQITNYTNLALEVSNIKDTLEILAKQGVALIDEKPGNGVENTRIAFLHPKETKVLLELVEPGE